MCLLKFFEKNLCGAKMNIEVSKISWGILDLLKKPVKNFKNTVVLRIFIEIFTIDNF